MKHRLSAWLGAFAVVIAVVLLVGVPVTGQAPSAAKSWTPPRTPDGQPDLQGIWNYATITPLERPSELAGKQILGDEEVAALEEQAAQRRIDRAPREGDPGTYNRFWLVELEVVDNRTSLVVDPADGRIPPLTPEAQKRQAEREEHRRLHPADSWEDRGLSERCLSFSVPRLGAGYNSYYQIFQTRDHVVILNEMAHDARVIPLDGREHVPLNIRQWLGDPRGRWEGNTLVVDTTNFSPKSNFMGSAEKLHVVERFTRVGPKTLNYEVTVSDPTTWTKPWTAMIPLKQAQNQIYEYACHEGNYGMFGILSGHRAQEKTSEEAAKKGSR